uniref:Uncharacterized protein n=1 Tax=Nelumbo nucifera TaxID=4432 RepID=A0A822ZG42_NELNU|nr:TPA_asm: hypothetical protein HUJ06_001700 [Nelumbo nucifera]
MGCLHFQLPQMGLLEKPRSSIFLNKHYRCSLMASPGLYPKVSCGLRSGPRKPLWRSRVLSTEAIQAVQSLKLAKSNSKLDEVFSSRLSRLLKADLIATLMELQRQNEFELALKPKKRTVELV